MIWLGSLAKIPFIPVSTFAKFVKCSPEEGGPFRFKVESWSNASVSRARGASSVFPEIHRDLQPAGGNKLTAALKWTIWFTRLETSQILFTSGTLAKAVFLELNGLNFKESRMNKSKGIE
ncbi:hypothetical protein AHMF7605_03885 [Adhaeribacter arboris]|uniref:Uncharacterized protein n=1 Tax=Adhaeribacter arboris TaxID=2072846 RepID=A0A2T2YB44_9BACT|nr:hypothetical protein AHMF7605_03885 [Adhaeribacter arboris]